MSPETGVYGKLTIFVKPRSVRISAAALTSGAGSLPYLPRSQTLQTNDYSLDSKPLYCYSLNRLIVKAN
jgi:hypothetical protein